MADQKITALTAATVLEDTDLLPMVQNLSTTPVTKKTAWSLVKSTLKTYFDTLYTSGTVPVKASAADALAGTDDAKFLTALAAKGLPSIYPDSVPDADHLAHGIKATFTANENQAFGDVCYINGDGEMQLGDADAIASSKIVGMCADATISANAAGNYLITGGVARDDTWAWTVGGFIYLTVTGTTTNTLSQTAPSGADDCVVIVGIATHADRMIFNPQLVIVEHTG